MEKEEGDDELGGEALEGGVGVIGEDEGDGEEEAKQAEGTRPANHKVHPSPTLSLSERGEMSFWFSNNVALNKKLLNY